MNIVDTSPELVEKVIQGIEKLKAFASSLRQEPCPVCEEGWNKSKESCETCNGHGFIYVVKRK